MRSEALLKEHELQRRELVIMRYDRQRSLCDQIITRQRQMLDGEALGIFPGQFFIIFQIPSIHPSIDEDHSPLHKGGWPTLGRCPGTLTLPFIHTNLFHEGRWGSRIPAQLCRSHTGYFWGTVHRLHLIKFCCWYIFWTFFHLFSLLFFTLCTLCLQDFHLLSQYSFFSLFFPSSP